LKTCHQNRIPHDSVWFLSWFSSMTLYG
jgi:hypothetical protein